jgi:hypothetical protein
MSKAGCDKRARIPCSRSERIELGAMCQLSRETKHKNPSTCWPKGSCEKRVGATGFEHQRRTQERLRAERRLVTLGLEEGGQRRCRPQAARVVTTNRRGAWMSSPILFNLHVQRNSIASRLLDDAPTSGDVRALGPGRFATPRTTAASSPIRVPMPPLPSEASRMRAGEPCGSRREIGRGVAPSPQAAHPQHTLRRSAGAEPAVAQPPPQLAHRSQPQAPARRLTAL